MGEFLQGFFPWKIYKYHRHLCIHLQNYYIVWKDCALGFFFEVNCAENQRKFKYCLTTSDISDHSAQSSSNQFKQVLSISNFLLSTCYYCKAHWSQWFLACCQLSELLIGHWSEFRGPTCTGKIGKPEKLREVFPVREKSGNFKILPKSHGILVQSGKFRLENIKKKFDKVT